MTGLPGNTADPSRRWPSLTATWTALAGATAEPASAGMSDAAVFAVVQNGQTHRFLKIAESDAAAQLKQETARTEWLARRGIRVPDIIETEERDGIFAVLMAVLPGTQASLSALPESIVVDAVAEIMTAVHALDAATCPFDESIAARLARAETAIAEGMVDADNFDDRNAGIAPETLFRRLRRKNLPENFAVIHGDATLENIIVGSDGRAGILDCGTAGRGDRYTDLAVLNADVIQCFGPSAAQRLRTQCNAEPWDEDKAAFFLDLYELY